MTAGSREELEAKLKQYVGVATGPARIAPEAVNEAMIRHWCEAMGDRNPVYTDPAAAKDSVHGGIVAPPTMMQAWLLRGFAMAEPDLGQRRQAAGAAQVAHRVRLSRRSSPPTASRATRATSVRATGSRRRPSSSRSPSRSRPRSVSATSSTRETRCAIKTAKRSAGSRSACSSSSRTNRPPPRRRATARRRASRRVWRRRWDTTTPGGGRASNAARC